MEVADLWRREWAGTAEFGKVTEGGVTRQVARAMEVLHASAPGARVRVMRAAYHSTAGPGIPASSYMLHSSRRVISSGFNILESPSFPSKPLEISSTPLESFPDLTTETENYKVTEPDDTEISEPSKWKVSSGSTLRMPSEESSSTDNASIIDLDNRSHRSIFRKYSYDSENSDILSSRKSSARASPLIDSPVTLSTLKYKSLLNSSSNDWNNRRKSYSFEDTCPANETIIHSNDILAMESSTDSGICKSSEIVDDQGDENTYFNSFDKAHKNGNIHDEFTFKDWLHKNRSNTVCKSTQLKPWRHHETVIEDPAENKISLKSPGKVCITVPITIEKDDNRYTSEDSDKKVKKVEFCKTELHFAAESGKVNIIATDEKPPPSYDFRKKRSAFVPISDKFEKPITLFGEKGEISDPIKNDFSIYGNSEITEGEIENTAATKSILKNKIPKPKPYLLGENTELGNSDNIYEMDRSNNSTIVSGVSLINKQLESERKYSNEKISSITNEIGTGYNSNYIRTINKGPSKTESHHNDRTDRKEIVQMLQNEMPKVNSVKKIHALPLSPVANAKTRQLRESDLMYFGINNERKTSINNKAKCIVNDTGNAYIIDDIFQSVKLIKRISNSAGNSEAESEDTPEYQNIILKPNSYQPIPKPRSKYNTGEIRNERTLQPIVERYSDNTNSVQESRRSRSKKYEEIVIPAPRSRSEPAKKQITQEFDKVRVRDNTRTNSIKRNTPSPRTKKHPDIEQRPRTPSSLKKDVHNCGISEDKTPLYVNLKTKNQKHPKSINSDWNHHNSEYLNICNEAKDNCCKTKRTMQEHSSQHSQHHPKSPDKTKSNLINKPLKTSDSLEKRQKSSKRTNKIQRTKNLVTPEQSLCDQPKNEDLSDNKFIETIVANEHNDVDDKINTKQKQRSHSSHRKPLDEKYLDIKQSAITVDKEKYASKHDKRHAVKEFNSNKESAKGHKIYGHSVNGDFKTVNTTDHHKQKEILDPKKDRTAKRSEYVINYDDKNGTVSSVCKIKPGHSQTKRKPVMKEKSKDNPKEMKYRTLNKTPLLQLPEQQWNRNGLPQQNRKWKIKNRVQRSCQLL